MKANKLKALWQGDQPALNGWCSIGSSFTAEIMAAQGFDSITIDMQHGALDYGMALPMVQALRNVGPTIMARVPWRDPSWIMKALDMGVEGIICPMVNSRAEAEEFVSYLRYPPHGQRSYGPTRAVIADPSYNVKDANAQVLAIAMIETAAGMEHLEEIAATPGLDGIYVGPADLTLGTQAGRLPPGFDREEPEMIAMIKEIAAVCRKNKIAACLHCGSPAYAARAIEWGYRLTTVGGDVRFLAQSARAAVTGWHEVVGRAAGSDSTGAGKGGY